MTYARADLVSDVALRPLPRTQLAASDESLITRIAQGDRQAMQALFVRHHVRVFRFVLGKVKDRTVAEDVVSDIFLEVWRNAHRFEARAAVSTWLLAIARHKAFSVLRSRRAHEDIDQCLAVEDTADSPYTAAETRDRNEVLRACLAKLSPSHREILDLVYYQEKPIEAVAAIVGIPLNTVKTRMFYARKQLATLLQQAGIDRATM